MEQIRLDLIPNGIMPNVHASQFDKSRTVRFNLYEGDTPFTLLATDNVKVTCNGVDDTTLATAGTSHDWAIPDSVVADSGIFIGELIVERGSKVIGSKNFVLNVEEDAYNGKNIEERTASGSIANFETNLQDNLTACKCEINPVQDLHGYTKPWSGGAGKNKYNATINSLHTSWDNGIYTITSLPSSGYSWRMDYVTLPAGNYILNGGVSVNYRCFIQLGSDYYTSTGNDAPFTLTEETQISVIGVIMPQATIGQKMKPMIRLASVSDASFEPYENICPISGFLGANIVRCGVNVWNEDIEQGAWSNSGTKAAWTGAMRSVDKFPIKPNTSYYFKFSGTVALYICWFDVSANFIERIVKTGSGTITTPSNAYYCAFCTSNDYGTTYNHDISINYPSTATTYEPYNGTTTAISFGQEVYGGVLDVTNGKLTITHKVLSIDNNSALYSSGNSAYLNITDAKIVNEYASAISDKYEYNTWSGATNGDNGYFTLYQNTAWSNARLAFNRNGLSLSDFITSLTGNPIQVVYELATPTEITLTPKQIEALANQVNNVYHDCNGQTEVKYLVEV